MVIIEQKSQVYGYSNDAERQYFNEIMFNMMRVRESGKISLINGSGEIHCEIVQGVIAKFQSSDGGQNGR